MSTATAAQVLTAARRREPSLGRGCRVVAIDGPAGSGKSRLAAALAQLPSTRPSGRGRTVEVLHMDDLYDGWRGVLSVRHQVRAVLRALDEHGVATHQVYDWHSGRYASQRRLTLPDLLVLEGVGCCHPSYDDLLTLRVWVDAPRDVRLTRGLARDGEHLREEWLRFLADEELVHARDGTRERADIVVDGVSGEVRAVRDRHRDPGGDGVRDLRAPR